MSEVTQLIPEIFYDVIGRMVPGLLALFLLSVASGVDVVRATNSFYASNSALEESSIVIVGTLLGLEYVVGQLLGALGNMAHSKVLPHVFRQSYSVLYNAVRAGENPYPASVQKFLDSETAHMFQGSAESATPLRCRQVTYLWYDRLRKSDGVAGVKLEKMRAEYKMLEGLYMAFALALVSHVLAGSSSVLGHMAAIDWRVVAALAGGFALCVWASARLFQTFQWSVINQYYAACVDPVLDGVNLASTSHSPDARQ